jgi:multisubunit Na+/H+ antiporter MnhG subunit
MISYLPLIVFCVAIIVTWWKNKKVTLLQFIAYICFLAVASAIMNPALNKAHRNRQVETAHPQ